MTESGPRTRSHTQYSTYVECSWRYNLKYIRNIPGTPAVWFAGGTAFHGAAELVAREVWARGAALGIEDQYEPAVVRFHQVLDEELAAMRVIEPDEAKWSTAGRKWGKPDTTAKYPNGQDEKWWRAEGPPMLQLLIDWWVAHVGVYGVATLPEGGPAVECGGIIEGDVPIRYHPDIVMFDLGTEALVGVDWKTGKEMPASTQQLGEYAVWFEKQYGMKIWYGTHYDARKGTLELPKLLQRWTPERVDRMFAGLDRAVKAEIFLPNLSKNCARCEWRTHCEFSPDYTGD